VKCLYEVDGVRMCPRCGTEGQPKIPFKRISCCCICGFVCENPEVCSDRFSTSAHRLRDIERKPRDEFDTYVSPSKRNYGGPFRKDQ